MKPTARQYEQHIQKQDKYIRDSEGRPAFRHEGTETVREGTCPTHHGTSTTFVGVNENGWIFKCSGKGERGLVDGPWHYYSNWPAEVT